MSVMTVGQAIVRFLDNQYVRFDGKEEKLVEGIFTVFGHGIVCGLGQALNENPRGLRVYQGRNEQGMAHVAAGFARQSNRRRLMVCASSIGPGAANMVTAVACATVNNVPLLVFTGDTFASRQPDPVLQQLEQPYDLGITTSDAFRPVSRYFDRIHRPETLMTALLNAMRVLTDPAQTGGVCISLPQDVQGESFDYPDSFFQKRIHHIGRTLPDSFLLEQAATLVKASKRPLVIAGGGAKYSEAGDALRQFCTVLHIPMCETQAGKSAVESSFALNLGGVGVTGNRAANEIAAQADLILGIGTRFSDFTTGSKELFRSPHVQFLTVNLSNFHAQKLDALPLVGDAKATVSALQGLLGEYTSDWGEKIAAAKADWNAELKRLQAYTYTGGDFQPLVAAREETNIDDFIKATGGVLTQTGALGIIRRKIEANAIVVGASGSLPGDLQRMWETDCPDSYHMEYGYSCMGYEIAAALGAKLAKPDQPVYSMVGDGSFMMLHSEMATAIQEGVKIVVLLFDNCGFGCINNLQMNSGMDSLATNFRYRNHATGKQTGDLIPTDFAKIAEGYGLASFTAKNPSELETALDCAKNADRAVLIDIKVLPKTMTDGYGAWWNVGLASKTESEAGKTAYASRQEKLKTARKY